MVSVKITATQKAIESCWMKNKTEAKDLSFSDTLSKAKICFQTIYFYPINQETSVVLWFYIKKAYCSNLSPNNTRLSIQFVSCSDFSVSTFYNKDAGRYTSKLWLTQVFPYTSSKENGSQSLGAALGKWWRPNCSAGSLVQQQEGGLACGPTLRHRCPSALCQLPPMLVY